MTSLRWLAVLGWLVAALGVAPAAAEPAEPESAPVAPLEQRALDVDLSRLQIRADAVVAPAGTAEAVLTLDPALQRTALDQLRAAHPVQGAVVVLEIRTGRVLVWAELKPAQRKSLFYEAQAPAASVFKLVTTVALFERGHVDFKQRVCFDGGEHGIYRRHLEPATGPGAACTAFSQALGHSRNAVYAQLVNERLMRADLIEVAERIGFNANVPFDVPVELGSLSVPYNDLAFARTAAGFEDTRLTPLGAAYLSFLIANGGRGARLSIVDHVGEYHAPPQRQELEQVMSPSSAWRLVRMMEVTVHSGTSLGAFSDEHGRSYLRSIRVAGKTGTLQPTPDAPTTSWFTGFAPSRRPELVVSVLLQNGPVWHRKANEVARDLFRSYFAARGVRGVTAP
ncbi:MAG TPA: penicillin-binding transpeptidase domain-containing protein [Polyangiaceae bacterium]|nr:penicillin-binding transpeptidase domain-containing protein [Polyangiaceae bacterium]